MVEWDRGYAPPVPLLGYSKSLGIGKSSFQSRKEGRIILSPRSGVWVYKGSSMRALLVFLLALLPLFAQRRVPPKRSSQIQDGFGINSDLPRDPYLPWDRHWWTRMFDAGVSWIRIGQYENTSDYTSWDWIEQKRGVLAIPAGLDDYVDSLVDNGVKVQVQLLYGNPIYTSPAARCPKRWRPNREASTIQTAVSIRSSGPPRRPNRSRHS